MSSNFFDANSFFIDEKVNMFKFENQYNVFNDKGENVGAIKQKLTAGQKALRLILNKPMLPFLLEIQNAEGGVEATISRGWTFWMSKITIADPKGTVLGTIKQKFKFFKPTFQIYNPSEVLIAEITGDWKAWNFTIQDAKGAQIGVISKKWAGALKEIFTTADKYNVMVSPDYLDRESKIAILAGAITIDMVLKESK
ncbi:scramblase [Flavobacterium rivuli WB 3.3-2 = DSM 21788]|uniref:Scramblase n=1 Tax=Flavobacterium rivuli WB 3.3-2 = DSM 21788 TaxID=1121895 RepID=A0A0A2M4R2_9FLAO|nr:phospholipid scramblase-related protein [Flavobacterium rivuli]KGO87622.1 scramblase [Flavobacterium rivuli WB 3.3-2 = DSM 21788]